MRSSRMVGILFLFLVLAIPVSAQQATSSSPQALILLQKSLASLTGGQPVTDVTLSGIARRIAGADDETGTATLKALSAGQSRMDFNFPSGARSEIRSTAATAVPVGTWAGPDGTPHQISEHNMKTDSSWFFPSLTLIRLSSVATYVGQETRYGQTVLHLTAWQQFPNLDPQGAAFAQRLSQTEIFLDPTTLLPLGFMFNTHADNNALLDLPVEIRFSDYRAVSGMQVPFRIQEYLNYSLTLDVQLQNVALNAGLSASAFSAL